MLLQLDARPVSYEQLVQQVDRIYAKVVIVEAKCIDIDKRQLAAAQEKDPLKKVQLEGDQWQLLIAHHQQVRTLRGTHSSTTYRAMITDYC